MRYCGTSLDILLLTILKKNIRQLHIENFQDTKKIIQKIANSFEMFN